MARHRPGRFRTRTQEGPKSDLSLGSSLEPGPAVSPGRFLLRIPALHTAAFKLPVQFPKRAEEQGMAKRVFGHESGCVRPSRGTQLLRIH